MVSLSLDSFSIGDSAPFFSELRLLPTRSDQDLQLRAHLRWVASSDFGIKVCVQHKAKIGPAFVASVNNLEIDFPVWIQVQLQKDLNGILRKLWHVLSDEIEAKISEEVIPGVFDGLLHPEGPSGEILPSSLPFKAMTLER